MDKNANVIATLEAGNAPIVCLCGSTRFMDEFHAANRRFSLDGWIVLTVEISTYDGNTDPQGTDPAIKTLLDLLHFRKIDLADYVYILNVNGYIGESTLHEFQYAYQQSKRVGFLEPISSEDQLALIERIAAAGGL